MFCLLVWVIISLFVLSIQPSSVCELRVVVDQLFDNTNNLASLCVLKVVVDQCGCFLLFVCFSIGVCVSCLYCQFIQSVLKVVVDQAPLPSCCGCFKAPTHSHPGRLFFFENCSTIEDKAKSKLTLHHIQGHKSLSKLLLRVKVKPAHIFS